MKFLEYKRDVEHHYDDDTWCDYGAISFNNRLLIVCWIIGLIIIVISSLIIRNVYLPVDEHNQIITEFKESDTIKNLDGSMEIQVRYKTAYGYVNRLTGEVTSVHYPINPYHFVAPIIVSIIVIFITSYYRKKEDNYDD